MKFSPALEAMRQELRVLGLFPFAAPLALTVGWEGFAAVLQARHVVPGFVALVLLVGLEAVLPLVAGLTLGAIAGRDAALEVLLTTPATYRGTTARRLVVILAWVLLIEVAATWATCGLFPHTLPEPGALALLAWLAPTLWLAAWGALLAYALRSRSASGAVLGCIWVAQLAFHGYFAAFGWTRPWFLFTTTFAPSASFWLTNRLELIATSLLCMFACWIFLGSAERRLRSEDA